MKFETFYPRKDELARKVQRGVIRAVRRGIANARRVLGGHCGGQQQFPKTVEAYEVGLALRFQFRRHPF